MPAILGEAKTQELQEAKALIRAFGLPLPRFLPRRYKYRNVAYWSGHLAFASDLILATQPALIVELGTHWGESYFTFCQTVQENGLDSLCYAVDHWRGDDHVGAYGEEVFEDVTKYNEQYYRPFSYLLRSSFDDALSQFADDSVGLLHIDGFHAYEAVRHDFHAWLPKVKPGGIILLHDICPKNKGYGVWRLWDEIRAEFPNTFAFHHSSGLGVVRKGEEGRNDSSSFTDCLFGSSPSVREEIRHRYAVYASHLENLLRPALPAVAAAGEADSHEIRVQVYPSTNSGYCEEISLLQTMFPGAWSTLVFELRDGMGTGPLRVDPASEPGFVEIGNISIHSIPSGELVWQLPALPAAAEIQAAGTALWSARQDGRFLMSLGDDPQLILPSSAHSAGELRLTISLRTTPATVPWVITRLKSEQDLQEFDKLAHFTEQKNLLIEEKNRLIEEKNQVLAEMRCEQAIRRGMQQSLSWRITAPVRSLMERLRAGLRKV